MDLRTLLKSSGVRNFSKLLSANVVAQVIGLVVYPILTRMYAPEDFGLLNLFLSISGVLVIFSTAEYYNAIVLPKDRKEGLNVVYVCISVLLFVVLLTLFSVIFAADIARLFDAPALTKYYWMMPILVFVSGGWNIVNYWYIRSNHYNCITYYQLSQSVLSASGKLGFGYAGLLSGGMIYSVVFAPCLALLMTAWKSLISLFKRKYNSREIWATAKKYRNFPLYSLPRSFVNMLAGQLPVLLLTPLFGSQYVGWWSMALLLGFMPISMVSKSIYQVLYQYTTERVNSHLLIGSFFRRFTLIVLMVGIPLFGVLYWFMPDLTLLFLGEGWDNTGVYLRWMLPWLLSSVLTSSTGFLSDIFFRQKIGFAFEILTALLRTIGVIIGVVVKDFSISIIGYVLGSCLAVTAQYIWLLTLTIRYDAQIRSSENAASGGSEK